MSEPAGRDEAFAVERSRLVGLAYRITGSRAEAEDIVQEAWLRWDAARGTGIENPAAWLTTVTSRLALDRLRSARHQREAYVGPWLPEAAAVEPGPADRAELAESLTVGFLTVLERLGPVERVVFLLGDVFGMPYDQVAAIVGRSPDACRQLASRARRRVREGRPRFASTDEDAWRVTAAFLQAAVDGDLAAVTALLAPGVVELSDGGGTRRAARRPVVGPHRVARFVLNLTRRGVEAGAEMVLHEVNGQPAVAARFGDVVYLTTVVSVVDGRIEGLWSLVNPDKTATLGLPPVR